MRSLSFDQKSEPMQNMMQVVLQSWVSGDVPPPENDVKVKDLKVDKNDSFLEKGLHSCRLSSVGSPLAKDEGNGNRWKWYLGTFEFHDSAI